MHRMKLPIKSTFNALTVQAAFVAVRIATAKQVEQLVYSWTILWVSSTHLIDFVRKSKTQ